MKVFSLDLQRVTRVARSGDKKDMKEVQNLHVGLPVATPPSKKDMKEVQNLHVGLPVANLHQQLLG